MANVHDVAAYILKKGGPMTAMKLEKLVYYAQAWSIVWDSKPLFRERIQAWVNGPVVPALYRLHRGKYTPREWPEGDPENLTQTQRETVDAVLVFYGNRTPQWLSDLTRIEKPWMEAREGMAPNERGSVEITREALEAYYSELPPA